MQKLFRLGFAMHLTLVVLISIGAYAGVLPTSIRAVPHLDFPGHFILIGALAFFLDGALGLRELVRGRPFPRLAPVLVLTVAGIEEYLQRLSPRRTSDWLDFLADTLGVCFFSWLAARAVRAVRAREGALVPSGSRT